VTLIVTVNGPKSIWLLADRRLSIENRPLRDDACKVMFLETIDGVAIFGYAGLGATGLGTEPADWMTKVLRGRNLSQEQCIQALAEAMSKEFPRHMVRMPWTGGGPAHHVLVPAFLGEEPRLYGIELVFGPDRKGYIRCTRHVVDKPALAKPPPLGIAGSGAHYLIAQDKRWARSLLRMVKAADSGRVSPLAVADHLAKLNNEVHLGVRDKSVGPCCIVAWQYSKGKGVKNSGQGHQFYTGTSRDASSPWLPTITNGMDLRAISDVIWPHLRRRNRAIRAGQPAKELNRDELNAELARLPVEPDENFR